MTDNNAIEVFRTLHRFSVINEHIEAQSSFDRVIQNIKLTRGAVRVSLLRVFHEMCVERTNKETTKLIFERLVESGMIPNIQHDLSSYDGFMTAVEEELVREMASGASFGGAMSGAGSNADINATGMAGVDKSLQNKKRKIDKIITRTL